MHRPSLDIPEVDWKRGGFFAGIVISSANDRDTTYLIKLLNPLEEDKMVDVPVSTFRGVLKQLCTVALSNDEREILDLCFPEFLLEGRRMKALGWTGAQYEINSYQPRPIEWGRLRRFAGSKSFPPSRYFTVCTNDDGFDRGTLVNEFMTYWSEATMVYPEVYDSTLLSAEERTEHAELSAPKLGLHVTKYRRHKPILGRTVVKEFEQFECVLPLTVSTARIDNIFDLRIPNTQEWFFQHFVSLEEEIGQKGRISGTDSIATYKCYKLLSFFDLLPTLVMPGAGGSLFHQAVGAWLRSHGVAGLVYPSARCDVYWKLLKKSPQENYNRLTFEFSGWNFVDYRDSGPSDWESLFGFLSSWVTPQKAGISLTRLQGDQSGWEIRGAEHAERRRVQMCHDILLGKLASPPGWDPRGGYRRPFYTQE